MRRFAPILGLLAAAGAMGPPAVAAGETTMEVQGHRGARSARPENTLAAFRYALAVGVDVIELDLAVTRDGRLAVTHDLEVNPELCLGPGGRRLSPGRTVRSQTLAELKKLDCGSLKNPRFEGQTPVPGERIPSLEEVFRLVAESPEPAAREVRFNIEAKSVPSRPDLALPPAPYAALIHRTVLEAKMARRVIVQSFDHRILKALKALDPSIPVAALVAHTLPDLAALARGIGAEVMSPNRDWITPDDVKALHRAGVRVVPWTANDPRDWERLTEMGVDGIITDDPAGLIRFLEERGLRGKSPR